MENSSLFKTILRIFVFFLSITLTVGGVMFLRRQELASGTVLLAGSLTLFFFSAWKIEKNPPTEEEITALKSQTIPILFIFAAANLAVFLIFNVTDFNRTAKLDHHATAEWILSVLSLSIGVLWAVKWRMPKPKAVLEWIKINRLELYLTVGIVLSGFFLRLTYLTDHPYPWSGDEAEIGFEAIRLLNGEKTNLFDTGWSGQPNASFLPTMLSILVFGRTIFAIKFVSALTGAFSVLALYLLGREWFGREVAAMASAFLVAYPVHLQFSRIGVDNIFDSLMAPLVLWLVFRAVRTRSIPAYLLAGITTGLTFYLYAGTRLVLALAIGAIIYISISQKGFLKSSLPQLGTYLGGMLVTINPIATFFVLHPVLFMTRIGQESIFLTGWLENQTKQSSLPVWQILSDQFSNTVLVFFARGTGANFLNFDRPYLTMLGAVFFLIGLAFSILRLRDPRHFTLQMWFWSVVFLGGVLTINPPANTRMVMTTSATGLFIALGIWQVSGVLFHLKFKRTWVYAINAALILLLASQNLSFYFGHYWNERLFQDGSGELAMEAGLELQRLGENYDYYLFGEPHIFADFPTTVYLAPKNKKVNLNADTISEFSITPGHGAFIVAIPDNRPLLQQIMDEYPGGSVETVNARMKTEVLYYAYILPPQKASTP